MSFEGGASGEPLVVLSFCRTNIAVKRFHLEARRACHVDDQDVDGVDVRGEDRSWEKRTGGEEVKVVGRDGGGGWSLRRVRIAVRLKRKTNGVTTHANISHNRCPLFSRCHALRGADAIVGNESGFVMSCRFSTHNTRALSSLPRRASK